MVYDYSAWMGVEMMGVTHGDDDAEKEAGKAGVTCERQAGGASGQWHGQMRHG